MINIPNNCIDTISINEFYIIDNIENKPAYIKSKDGQFKIINNTNKSLSFLKIDNCIDFNENTQKCDCALFDNNIFCFIELKTMQSNKATIKKKRRKKAEEQLKNTINYFKDTEIVKNKIKEAYVSITCFNDSNLIQVPLAPNQDKILEFKEDLNTKLYYSCKKEFN